MAAKKKSATSDTCCVSGPSDAERKRWQAEDDLRTLSRAKEIERDAARMKAVRALAKEQLKAADEAAKL